MAVPRRTAAPTVAPLAALTCTGAAASGPLAAYTWPDYIDPGVVAEFEAEFDTSVEFSCFDPDATRDEELTANNATGFDVLPVNGLQMQRYAERGWIAPLDPALVSNAELIQARWRLGNPEAGDVSGTGDHGAAYFWGTLGIAWRGDPYPAGFRHRRDLLVPDESLRGRILMSSFGRELVGFALNAEGHSINTTDRALIREAGRMLLAQHPYVRGYGYPAPTTDSSPLSGETWAAIPPA